MTKKDYVAIGKAIRSAQRYVTVYAKETLTDYGAGFSVGVEIAAHKIADILAEDNPAFDRARFLRFVETGKDTRS